MFWFLLKPLVSIKGFICRFEVVYIPDANGPEQKAAIDYPKNFRGLTDYISHYVDRAVDVGVKRLANGAGIKSATRPSSHILIMMAYGLQSQRVALAGMGLVCLDISYPRHLAFVLEQRHQTAVGKLDEILVAFATHVGGVFPTDVMTYYQGPNLISHQSPHYISAHLMHRIVDHAVSATRQSHHRIASASWPMRIVFPLRMHRLEIRLQLSFPFVE